MTHTLIFGTLAGLAFLALVGAADEYEEGRWSHIDVDEVLGNQRILASFIKCFLDQGPCTADAKDMKKLLPEMIESYCSKCTPSQKKLMAKAVKFVKENRPDDWEQLSKKYDPDQGKGGDVDKFIKEATES